MPVEVASQVDISYQEEFWVGRTTGGGSWAQTQILGVETVAMPEKTPEDIDVSHQQSPGRSRETLPGLLAAADATQEMQYWPGHASQMMLEELAGLSEVGTPEDVQISFVVGGVQRTYRGQIRGFTPTGTVGEKRMASLAFKVFERILPNPTLGA